MADTAAADVLAATVVTVVTVEDGAGTTAVDVSTVTAVTAIVVTVADAAATAVTAEPVGTDHRTGGGVAVSDGHTPHVRLAVSASPSLTVSP